MEVTRKIKRVGRQIVEAYVVDKQDFIRKDDLKRYLYQKYADPLFFKYHRGEIDKQEWLDKVEEIKREWS